MSQSSDLDEIEFDIWYQNGVDRGWISPMVCLFHDGVGLTNSEMLLADEDMEPCVWVMRRYHSTDERHEVEVGHPPSLWRKNPPPPH